MFKNLSLDKSAAVMLIVLCIAHALLREDGSAFTVVIAITVTALFLKTEDKNFWFAWGTAGFIGIIVGIGPWSLSNGEVDIFTSFLMTTGWVYVGLAPLSNFIMSEEKQQEENKAKA